MPPNVTNSSMGCYLNNTWSQLQRCVYPGLSGAAGGSDALFGLLVGSGLIVTMWLADDQGSLAAPSVVLILVGGALLPMLPGNFRGFAWTLIILGIAAGIGLLAARYVMSPGVQLR